MMEADVERQLRQGIELVSLTRIDDECVMMKLRTDVVSNELSVVNCTYCKY